MSCKCRDMGTDLSAGLYFEGFFVGLRVQHRDRVARFALLPLPIDVELECAFGASDLLKCVHRRHEARVSRPQILFQSESTQCRQQHGGAWFAASNAATDAGSNCPRTACTTHAVRDAANLFRRNTSPDKHRCSRHTSREGASLLAEGRAGSRAYRHLTLQT